MNASTMHIAALLLITAVCFAVFGFLGWIPAFVLFVVFGAATEFLFWRNVVLIAWRRRRAARDAHGGS